VTVNMHATLRLGAIVSLARRIAEIAPFHVMELLARARELEAQDHSIAPRGKDAIGSSSAA
jgi:hypothetical protein